MRVYGFLWRLLITLWMFFLIAADSRAQKQEIVTIRLANIPLRSATGVQNKAELAVFDAFFKKYPHYRFERVTGLALPEGLAEAQQMMAFAADRAPDVFDLSIRQVQNYIRQGLLYPVDDLIREHRKRNPQWKPPSLGLTEHHYDAARGPDGRLYAVVSDYWILGLWYRRDLFEEAGIVPPRPPKDWQEFFEFAQRLTDPEKHVKGARFQTGQYGTALRTGYTAGYIFTNFVYQAGGDMTLQERTCPYDGTVNEFKQEDKQCLCRKCGRSLAHQSVRWKVAYGREPGQRALRFYKKLRWTEWTRCPDCKTPNNLPVAVCPKCKEENPIRAPVERISCRVCGTVISVKPEQARFHCKQCKRDLRRQPVYVGVVRVGGDPGIL
jgi:ABC-type sugar transport system, periplasmic component